MTVLYLIRHGVTAGNLNYTLLGRTDVPLHPLGHEQAESLAKALCDKPIQAVFSSPLLRAKQTAEPIANFHGVPNQIRPALTELDLGQMDGMSSFHAYDLYPSIMDQALDETLHDFAFPGGELRSGALRRFEVCIRQICVDYPHASVCVVTHGGPLGLWLAQIQNEPLGRFRSWQPANGSVTSVTLTRTATPQLLVRSDTSHLSQSLNQRLQEARQQFP